MSKNKKFRLYNGYKIIGIFELLENKDRFSIEFQENLDTMEIPFDFMFKYEKGQRVFSGNIVWNWIKDRVVPSSRQNISTILKNIGLEEYDELEIFLYCKGKFTQDNYWIEEFEGYDKLSDMKLF